MGIQIMDTVNTFLTAVMDFFEYEVSFSKRAVIIYFLFLLLIDMIGLLYAQIQQKIHVEYFRLHAESGFLKANLVKVGLIIMVCIRYDPPSAYAPFVLLIYILLLLRFWYHLFRKQPIT